MAGMLQILTYMLALYMVLKGVEILQIGLASNREKRGPLIVIGLLALTVACVGAFMFPQMQDDQAEQMSARTSNPFLP